NSTAPSALINKSIVVYDENFNPVFEFADQPADAFKPGKDILNQLPQKQRFFFEVGRRDAVAMTYNRDGRKFYVITTAYDGDKAEWIPKLKLILIVSFVVSLSIVVVSGYVFSLGLVKSISEFTNRVNRISSEEFSQRLSTGSGRDELQKLAATI